MPYYARLQDNNMQIFIETDGQIANQRIAITGSQLLDFIYYDLKKLNNALDEAYVFATSVRNPDFNYLLNKMDTDNIYLRFFADLFLDTLINDAPTTKAGYNKLCDKFNREVAFLKQYKAFAQITYRTVSKPFLIGVFSVHALTMQTFMKEQLEFCVNSTDDKEYRNLSPTERLYIYEQWRKAQGEQPLYFNADTFSSRLIINESMPKNDAYSTKELAHMLKKNKPQISEMTVLPNGWALMRFELMKMITQGVMVKKCENCNRYCIPDGRSDIEYCTRSLSDQHDKTCQSIGALKKHQQKTQKNPIHKEYSRAYKRNHSRVGAGSMSQSEFLAWSDEAREKRDLCLAGKIDSFTFKEWLNKDRKYKKRS